MHLRNLLLLVVLGALIIFAALNWNAIMAPTTLSLLFTTMQAPLGLILLTITALLVVLFLGFVVSIQSSVMMERRRLVRDLQAQRELASQAEASRITELHAFLQSELQKLAAQNADARSGLETRLGQVEQTLNAAIEQTGNTMSAYIGELGDRLENKTGGNP